MLDPVSRLAVADAGWTLTLYPQAGEAGYSFQYSVRAPRMYVPAGRSSNPERSRAEMARRARGRVRRYCAANLLDRMGTLTYAGAGQFVPGQGSRDVGQFFRRLRRSLGGKAFPYLWVPEWHPGGHGLHFHFAVGKYIRKSAIEAAWGHGIVHIGRKSMRHGISDLERSRIAARYLAKYVSKTFEDEPTKRHRFDVAQGFKPAASRLAASDEDELFELVCSEMGGELPSRSWSSRQEADWQGPPAGWFQWG